MTTRPLLAVLVLTSGCASLSSAQRADTLGAGGLQVAVEPTVQVSRVTAGNSLGGVGPQSLQGAGFVHPAADAAIRYGVHELMMPLVQFRLGVHFGPFPPAARRTTGG